MRNSGFMWALVLLACDAGDSEGAGAGPSASEVVAANELARASAVLSGCMGIHVVLAADVLTGDASLYFGPLATEAWRAAYVTCLSSVEGGCADASACGIEFFQGPCDDRCEAGVLTRCGDDGGAHVACDDLGGMCFGGTDCVPAGAAACTLSGPLTCDGDVLTGCHTFGVEEGFVATIDCAAEGRRCVDDGSGEARCACDGDACAEVVGACDRSEPPTCIGSVLGACTLGERTSVDCTTLGFTSCNPGVGCAD